MPSTKYSGVAIPRGGIARVNGVMQAHGWYGDPEQGERVIEVSGDVARSWVVTLLPRGPSLGYPFSATGTFTEQPPDAMRAYARITWGMLGGQAALVAEVDIGYGVTVPVHGSSVFVDVLMPTQNASPNRFLSGYKVRVPTIVATCAPANGPVHSEVPLTRELYVGNVGPAEVKLVGPIPRFAKTYTVMFGGEYTMGVIVEVTEANPAGAAMYLYDRWYLSGSGLTMINQPRWVPRVVPNDGGGIRITSMEATNTVTDLRVIFNLAL